METLAEPARVDPCAGAQAKLPIIVESAQAKLDTLLDKAAIQVAHKFEQAFESKLTEVFACVSRPARICE